MEGYEPTQAKIEPRRGNVNEKPNSVFSASEVALLLAEGSGKTRMSYILKKAMESVGVIDGFETAATRHGKEAERDFFHLVAKPRFKDAVYQADVAIKINDNLYASPDILIEKHTPLDVKSQYTIYEFISQSKKLPKRYYYQSQCQMMCYKSLFGYMACFLTKPRGFAQEDGDAIGTKFDSVGNELWYEYNFPLDDRYHIHEIKADEQSQYEILQAVEAAVPVRDNIVDKLTNAKVMSIEEFFYSQMKMNRYRKIKEASNLLNIEYIRVGNDFFYEVK